jgi:hypothetical protein
VRGLRKRTKSPTLKVLCFTVVSVHAFVSAWYSCMSVTALILSDSNKFFSSASVGQGKAFDIVWELLCLISSSVTALVPNNSQNGDKFVSLETNVL